MFLLSTLPNNYTKWKKTQGCRKLMQCCFLISVNIPISRTYEKPISKKLPVTTLLPSLLTESLAIVEIQIFQIVLALTSKG